MIGFVIKSTICLTILYGFYHLFLQNIKSFEFNRFYLLFSLVFALIIPFVSFKIKMDVPLNIDIQKFTYSTGELVQGELVNAEPIPFMTFQNSLIIFYLIISSILVLRFILNIYRIIMIIRKNTRIKYSFENIVLHEEKALPYSFLRYIFVNRSDFENGKIEKELIIHEQTHCVQYHTIDILLIEVLKIILWYNPLIWLFKKAIQLNHEFLADNKVLSTQDLNDYQHKLINLVFRNNSTYLASNFNYSLTKKRLIMMTKQKSNERAFLKKMMLLPIIAILVVFIACSREEKLNITSNTDIRTEFLNNMGKAWWYPILRKHNIEPHRYNTFDNVFEMGSTNSIDNRIVTLKNAFFLIRMDSDNYMIFRSSLAYHDLDSNIIIRDEGSLEKYSLKSKDTISLETLTAKKIKIQLEGKSLEATEAIYNDNHDYQSTDK